MIKYLKILIALIGRYDAYRIKKLKRENFKLRKQNIILKETLKIKV